MKVIMVGVSSIATPRNGYENHIASILNEFAIIGEPIEYISVALNNGRKHCDFLTRAMRYFDRVSPFILTKVLLIIYKKRPDIIHMQGVGITPGLFAYIFYRGKAKKIITVHGFGSDEMVAHGIVKADSFIHKLIKRIEKKALDSSDAIIAVDSMKKTRIERSFLPSQKNLVVIANGFDKHAFNPDRFSQIDKLSVRNMLEAKSDDWLIIEVKAFHTNNGQEILLRAMSKIIYKHPNVKLILVGDGPEGNRLNEVVDELGIRNYVRFLGTKPHDDIPILLYACDISVLPSSKSGGVTEGSSVFLMESMAMGKITIASDVGGNRDIIRDGSSGLLFTESSIEELAEKINKVIDDSVLRQTLVKNAQLFAHERDWAYVAAQLNDQYNLVVQAK